MAINPFVCDKPNDDNQRFTLEGIALCTNTNCPGWVEVGWKRAQLWSSNKVYCYWKPINGPGFFTGVGVITQGTHVYRQELIGSGPTATWSCTLDGFVLDYQGVSTMGFSSGTHLVAQGETDSKYSQIGKLHVGIPADSVLFDQMQYKTGSSWITLNIDALDPICNGPNYGCSEPAAGQMLNWTN